MSKVLIDSNIIIYAATDTDDKIAEWLSDKELYVSALSYVEVLGFSKLSQEDKDFFEEFFSLVNNLPIDSTVIRQAAHIRQVNRITIADAIIAATALTHNLALATRNVKDFNKIAGLAVINPFD
ncbi:type II toxin-antitoxin system VapC family toxin [Rhodoflexus caldus]|uniref:type II toxin-antitoxin system VapC family toxin n=1 Tax=Rhodoflexus caldus TaxID=2891236 RepID=UPI00202A77AA|nr:type II toxin-antitoxin system VapC family toxin [Rhodoflexus caldus]